MITTRPDRTQALEQVARAASKVMQSRDYGPSGGTDIVSWDAMEELSFWLAMLSLLPSLEPVTSSPVVSNPATQSLEIS
jgi:hypothetical protein